ncbi:MAG: hypothetical protein IJ099_05010 [Alphaproteobacteria bacterium]|nr:hypothetical protein [Alphaproteobacteria bacterium]
MILLNEIGSAGPYPPPGVKRAQKDEFERKLKESRVDAVISGNGGCGICTPKEEGSCISAEYSGIPCVMIAAPGFVEQAKSTALTAGVTVQRVAVYPGAFSAHTNEELKQNTRNILWPQIVDGLTKPITDEEINEASSKIKIGKDFVISLNSLEEVQDFFENQGWSDGLPIVLPTKKKVDEFLKYTSLDKDYVIGNIPPSYRKATVYTVAVIGAMSGAKPEYMPILIAFTKAMMNGDFRRTLSSTHAWTPFIWLNGPLVRQLGISSEQGEISEQNNKKIGRFIDLAMLNLGGFDIKKNRMGTFGYLSSWVMAEDEEANARIGWLPYHVQQGYNINDNTLTAASSLNWGNNLTPATSDADKIMELMSWDAVEKEQFALGGGTPFVYRTFFITEYVARDLASKYSKDELEDALIKNARRPLDERAYANFYANPGSSFDGKHYTLEQHKDKIAEAENASTTKTPNWLKWTGKAQMETVPVMKKGKTAIVVTGDANRNKVLTVPGGGMATIKIELPDNWDLLMQELGYKPLESYFLTEITPQKLSLRSSQQEETAASMQYNHRRLTKEQYMRLRQQRGFDNKNNSHRQRPTKEQYQKMRQQRRNTQN